MSDQKSHWFIGKPCPKCGSGKLISDGRSIYCDSCDYKIEQIGDT